MDIFKYWIVEFTNKKTGSQYDCMVESCQPNPSERYLVFGALLKMNNKGMDTDDYIHIKNGIYIRT